MKWKVEAKLQTWASKTFAVWQRLSTEHNINPGDASYNITADAAKIRIL